MMLLEKAAAYHVISLQARTCSPHTLRQYALVHRGFIAYAERVQGAPPTVAALTAEQVRGYLAAHAERGMAPASLNVHIAVLRAWCRVLADDLGLFPDGHPLEKLKAARVPKTVPAVLTRQQFDLLAALAAQAHHPLRSVAILKLLVETGTRVNELCSLRLADYQPATAALAGRILVREGKGGKQRHCGFGLDASNAVAAYVKRERRGGPDSPWLFTGQTGERLNTDTVRKLLRALRAQAGLSADIHPHTLRHTFATWRTKAGMNASVLQHQLGHATIEQSQRYVTLAAQDVESSYISMLDGPAPRAQPVRTVRQCTTCGCHAPGTAS